MKNIISQRRSIFPAQFSPREVSNLTIEALVKAAHCAPTHRKTEPWRFKIFQKEAKKALGIEMTEMYAKTAERYSQTKSKKIVTKVEQSAVVIAICMQRDAAKRVPEWEEIAATAMAVQNLWLQATDLGLGGYWSSPAFASHMDTFLALEPGERCLGFFYLGYFEGPVPQRTRTPWQEKVRWFE
ncbi:MAG: nitroreductase family protein [Flavobacteriaceae bacterium]